MSSDNNAITTTDKDFLINMAIYKFNSQYNKSFTNEEMDVISIPNNSHSDYAYEVFTVDSTDSVRLRMYLNLSTSKNYIDRFRLRAADINPLTTNEPYAYVTTGFVNRRYIWADIIDLGVLEVELDTLYGIDCEDGTPMLTESGNEFIQEVA